MIPIIDHTIAQSLKEFLNWKCLRDLRAFKTVSGQLTPYSPRWQGKTALASPYAGFVYDSGINGAVVPTGLPGVSGAYVDYRNGRFIAPTGSTYTGYIPFSIHEINFYVSSSSESKLIFETQVLQSPELKSATGYIPENAFVAPCVFVKNYSTESEDHCLGGESRLTWNFKIVAMTRTEKELYGIQKVVRDCQNDIFPMITGSVFNPYGGLRDPNWTYGALLNNPDDYAFICDSTFKIVEADVFTDDNPKMFVGIGNIEIDYYYTPIVEATVEYGGNLVDSDDDIIGDSDSEPIFAAELAP